MNSPVIFSASMSSLRTISQAAPWTNYDVFQKNKFDAMYVHPRSNVGVRKLIEDTSFARDFVVAFNKYFKADLPTSFVKTYAYNQMPLAVCLTNDQNHLVIDFREEFSTDCPIYKTRRCSAIVLNTSIDFGSDELTLAVVSKNGYERLEHFSEDDKVQLHFVNKEKLVAKNNVFYRILDAICNPGDIFSANSSQPILSYLKENLHISKCFRHMIKEQQLELLKNEEQFSGLMIVGEVYKFI